MVNYEEKAKNFLKNWGRTFTLDDLKKNVLRNDGKQYSDKTYSNLLKGFTKEDDHYINNYCKSAGLDDILKAMIDEEIKIALSDFPFEINFNELKDTYSLMKEKTSYLPEFNEEIFQSKISDARQKLSRFYDDNLKLKLFIDSSSYDDKYADYFINVNNSYVNKKAIIGLSTKLTFDELKASLADNFSKEVESFVKSVYEESFLGKIKEIADEMPEKGFEVMADLSDIDPLYQDFVPLVSNLVRLFLTSDFAMNIFENGIDFRAFCEYDEEKKDYFFGDLKLKDAKPVYNKIFNVFKESFGKYHLQVEEKFNEHLKTLLNKEMFNDNEINVGENFANNFNYLKIEALKILKENGYLTKKENNYYLYHKKGDKLNKEWNEINVPDLSLINAVWDEVERLISKKGIIEIFSSFKKLESILNSPSLFHRKRSTLLSYGFNFKDVNNVLNSVFRIGADYLSSFYNSAEEFVANEKNFDPDDFNPDLDKYGLSDDDFNFIINNLKIREFSEDDEIILKVLVKRKKEYANRVKQVLKRSSSWIDERFAEFKEEMIEKASETKND